MILKVIFIIFALLSFTFFFWRRLREDYQEEQIFATSFYILFGIGLGSLVSIYLPDWWFWLTFFGAAVGLFLAVLRFNLRVFETIEAGVISFFSLLGIIFLYDWLQSGKLYSFFGMLIILLLSSLFLYLDKHYKGFVWYKSGRVGFSGLTVLGTFFIIYSLVAVTLADVIPFVGERDSILSAVLSFACFLAVFNLARKTI
jgi:hypothetical protein